jgi:SAM-dependent methyltransferase
MEKLQTLINEMMANERLRQATLSNPRRKGEGLATKVNVKPVLLKGERQYQFTSTVGAKVLHANLGPDDAAQRLLGELGSDFKQGLLQAEDADYQVLVNKHGKASIIRQNASRPQVEMEHNRKKRYLLEEGTPIPFLVELGVMTPQGKVAAAKYDKFRQINRFLEMIDDVEPYLAAGRRLNIVDFGCGKSYLTFALYHYLVNIRQRDIQVTGLDLKADVIARCSALAGKLGYDSLRFETGDINGYTGQERVDMVVTLHACDTATDAALEKAVRWDADVILSVPCCQHELFGQVSSEVLSPMLDHGIIKERFSALATDSLRANLLELVGYKAQILEFIDLEHTPKNLLIRAVKQEHTAAYLQKQAASYLAFKNFLNLSPYLERILGDKLEPILGERQALG